MLELRKIVLGKLNTNCYVLGDTDSKEAFVIDAPAHGDRIYEFVNELGWKVKALILTHGHFDHILGLPEFVELTGAPVYIHEEEAKLLNNKEFNLTAYFIANLPEIKVDKTLCDGEILMLGENEIKVIHTPGHTAGGICLHAGEILISGDTLFENSVGRIDHLTGDMELEVESIKTKLLILDDDTKVFPGHGSETTIGRERKENMFLR